MTSEGEEVLLSIHGILQLAATQGTSPSEPTRRRDGASEAESAAAAAAEIVIASSEALAPASTSASAKKTGDGNRHLSISPPGQARCMVRTLRIPTAPGDEARRPGDKEHSTKNGSEEHRLKCPSLEEEGGQPGSTNREKESEGVLARIHVLQVQPTDRDIEDRFSVRLIRSTGGTERKCQTSGLLGSGDDHASAPGLTSASSHGHAATASSPPTEKARVRLQLGVYDGHRGPWSAEYVAATLPERLDGVGLLLGSSSSSLAAIGGSTGEGTANAEKAVRDAATSVFEDLDREILDDFELEHQPVMPKRDANSQPGSKVSRFLKFGRKHRHKDRAMKANIADQRVRKSSASSMGESLSALRAVSGCTASVLVLEWEFDSLSSSPDCSSPAARHHHGPGSQATGHASCMVNLGDSRTIIADLSSSSTRASDTNTPLILRQTVDVNSSTPSERAHILSQHHSDDPRDLIVGKRLFGETLSTRGFGDVLYKLPLCRQDRVATGNPNARAGGSEALQERLSPQEKAIHRHYVERMSAALVAAQESRTAQNEEESGVNLDEKAAKDGNAVVKKPRTVPLADRYDAMFFAYSTPPYVSATPDVQLWHQTAAGTIGERCVYGNSDVEHGAEISEDICHRDGGKKALGAKGASVGDHPGRGDDEDRRTSESTLALRERPSLETATKRCAILATDGLWDLASSEEAVACVQREVAKQSEADEANLAEALYRFVVDEKGQRPGDDVTILVIEYSVFGFLGG